jgi:hypothetical protein
VKEHILHLHPHDDFGSARDKIAWAQAGRVVLVWPDRGQPLSRRLDLVLLHRHADRMGARLGFVTADPHLADLAQELGIPTFDSVEASHLERWPYRRPTMLPARPKPPTNLQPPPERVDPFAAWPDWALRLARLEPIGRFFLFTTALAALLALAFYLLPAATVRLTPASQALRVTVALTADPAQAAPDMATRTIPARIVEVRLRTSVSAVTSGLQEQPSTRATGQIVFTNRRAGPVSIPKGTLVRTTGGRTARFVTTQAAVTPAEPGGSVTVPIEAVDPGPGANVAAEQINAIDGSIAFQLAVVNPQPTSGGAVLTVATVTEADQEALREMALAQIRQQALAALEGQLGENEFLAPDTARVEGTPQETFSHFVGEKADSVTIDLQATVTATAVNLRGAQTVALDALNRAVGPGATLVPDSAAIGRETTLAAGEDGRVSFSLLATGRVVPQIDGAEIRRLAQGQAPEEASQRVQAAFDLAGPPRIELWPAWLDRLPWLGAKIHVVVTPE